MAQLYLTETQQPAMQSRRLHPSLAAASTEATSNRQSGETTVISRVTTKALPIREVLAALFNHDMTVFESTVEVKTVTGLKKPKLAKDG